MLKIKKTLAFVFALFFGSFFVNSVFANLESDCDNAEKRAIRSLTVPRSEEGEYLDIESLEKISNDCKLAGRLNDQLDNPYRRDYFRYRENFIDGIIWVKKIMSIRYASPYAERDAWRGAKQNWQSLDTCGQDLSKKSYTSHYFGERLPDVTDMTTCIPEHIDFIEKKISSLDKKIEDNFFA